MRRQAEGAGDRSKIAEGFARACVEMALVANGTSEQDTREEACEALDGLIHRLTAAPAVNVDDVALKLAAIILELVRSSRHGSFTPNSLPFILASCALADLTNLRGGAIALPAGALDPIDNPEAIARWGKVPL